MVDSSEISELTEVYKEMDNSGKKKMVIMAKNLLNVQQIGKGENDPLNNDKECEENPV